VADPDLDVRPASVIVLQQILALMGHKNALVSTDAGVTAPEPDSSNPFDLELLRGARIQLEEQVEGLTARVYQLLAQGKRKHADTLASGLTRTLDAAIGACQRMSQKHDRSTSRRAGK
jgi:D-ribose pyranose/furanose isomerase RbsD